MDFTTLTIEALKMLAHFVGNYGLAIIVLTIIVRMFLWPLNVSQQRSMRQMQTLQPKLKAIQERYKNDPQKMQMKMMEFYKEHKFNPMGGCLPLLVQMPVFILATTLRATAGISNDGMMGTSKYDTFILGKTATVYLPNETLENVKVDKPNKALEVQGELIPGDPIDFKVSLDQLDLKFSQLDQIQKADMSITDVNTKETEKVTFERNGGLLTASVPSKEVEHTFHWDVLVLIALFGLTMWLSQKLMMAQNKNAMSDDPTQQAIQKSMGTFMPVMIIATFVIIPIPAGVLIYLIVSNVIQVLQTVIVNKQMDAEEAAKKVQATDGSKVIEAEIVDEKKPEVNGSILDTLKKKFGQK